MKKVLLITFVAVLSLTVFGQPSRNNFNLSDYGVKIKPDKRLISVMATLEIGGLKTPLSNQGEQFRKTLKADLKTVSPVLKQKIDIFLNHYKKQHSDTPASELTTPFISMAYSLSEAPALNAPERSADMPDDLLEVLDFAQLVKEFYKTPGVAANIDNYFANYSKTGEALRPSAEEMVRDILDYLHTKPQLIYTEKIIITSKKNGKKKRSKQLVETKRHQRNFSIVPEMLAPKNAVNFLNIRDNYYAIISPATNLSSSEVRRAYLQFVLDPLVLENAKDIAAHRTEIKKLLDARRKSGASVSPDVLLAVSRSLVAAVDIREEEHQKGRIATIQARNKIDTLTTKTEQKAVADELKRYKSELADDAALELSESYKNGAVLAFYFAKRLQGIEDSGFDIANSLNDWITSLTSKNEKNRLKEFAEARNRAFEKKQVGKLTETTLAKNPVTKKLFEVDKLVQEKKYSEAEKELKALLNDNPNQARIFYTLGQVVNLSAGELKDPKETKKRLELAIVHYSNAIRAVAPITEKTPIADIAWVSQSYFALGRIYEFYDQKEYALKIYETVLKVGRIRGGAYSKAIRARQKLANDK